MNNEKNDSLKERENSITQKGGGIELLFSSISNNKIVGEETIYTQTPEKKLSASQLYIDFNSIVHVTQAEITSNMNKLIQILLKMTNEEKQQKKLKDVNLNKQLQKLEKEFKINLEECKFDVSYIRNILLSSLDNLIIETVSLFIINMVANFVTPEKLELIHIDCDSVPTKAKMLEQKRRRFMSVIVDYTNKQLYKKYLKEIKEDSFKYAKEELKIKWNTVLISPNAYFMKLLIDKIKSVEFIKIIKKFAKNLKTYIVSDLNEYGEGERKIMDYLLFNTKEDTTINSKEKEINKIVIFSPDSDMTILALLMGNRHIKILRHNQQQNNYDVIHMVKLRQNLFSFFQKNITEKLDEQRLINDIALIFNIFGNDFIPKIESINVKNNFEFILETYKQFLIKYNMKWIVHQKVKSMDELSSSFDYDLLVKFLEMLAEKEPELLYDNYMNKTFRDYHKLKNIFETVYPDSKYSFNKLLKYHNEFVVNYNELCKTYLKSGIILGGLEDKKDFWLLLVKVVKWKNKDEQNENNPTKIKNNLMVVLDKKKKSPYTKLMLNPYNKNFTDSYHQEKFANQGLDKKSSYDIELYKWNNLLEPYNSLLGFNSAKMGKVTINDDLTWKLEDQREAINEYYSKFINDKKNGSTNDHIMNEYFKIFVWTFNYYWTYKKNTNEVSTWTYEYTRAPLLRDLVGFLKKQNSNYLENTNKELRKFDEKIENYFTLSSHIEFITPLVPENLNMFDEIDTEKIKKIQKNIVKFKQIASWIVELDKNIQKYIDCSGAMYITKCHTHF